MDWQRLPVRFATTFVAAAAICLTAAPKLAQAQSVMVRWIGPSSCGEWHRNSLVGRSSNGEQSVAMTGPNFDNAMILNWVLAFLSGYASARQSADLVSDTSPAAVAGWLDNYCTANPLDSIPTAAFKLRNELLQRQGSEY